MKYHSNPKNNVPQGEAGDNSGFFLEDDVNKGQFDKNMNKYRQKQIQLANRIEDLTSVALWETKGQFAEYDHHLCKDNDPRQFVGVATLVPGRPIGWQKVDALVEMKYRTVPSTKFNETLLDADKLMKMSIRTHFMKMDCYVIWAFTDGDQYWKVVPGVQFRTSIGRNTKCTEDLPYEYKPVVFIPMQYLKPVTKEMFENGRDT